MYKTKKFKVWESDVLFDAVVSAVGIKKDIEAMDLQDPSNEAALVGTVELFQICAALEAAYAKLEAFSLVQNGNPNSKHTIH